LVDPRPPLGIAIESSTRGAARRLAPKLPTFVLPLASTVLEHTSRAPPVVAVLDASTWWLQAAGQVCTLRTKSPTATTLLLTVHGVLEERAAETYPGEVDAGRLRHMLSTSMQLPRTRWVSEVAQRYAFERSVCRRRANTATAFLEVELLKEWYFVGLASELRMRGRSTHVEASDAPFARACAWIDAHLDQRCTVRELAGVAGVSPRALLRSFQRSLGLAPGTYVRSRRLDEALLLLRGGVHSVGEVASAVGYGDLSAFSEAFRRRFGEAPSRFRRARIADMSGSHDGPGSRFA
jgi:AraC-like DNA-binding protein